MKPNIFIGSSSEQLLYAYALQEQLKHNADIRLWNQGFFELNTSYLDSLITGLKGSDFGVFIFAPDDILKLRDRTHVAVRDNVLFEFGLFMGNLGKERVFFILPQEDGTLRLPSDLLGISTVTFDASRSSVEAALGPACFKILQAISKFGIRQERLESSSASSLKPKAFAKVEHLSISDAVRTATAYTKPIKHLRIFASTTDVILPVIRDNRLDIDLCELALQWFDNSATDKKLQTLYAQCENNIAFWTDLKHMNYINRIILVRYPFTPSHFVILVDETFVISGLYCPSESPTSAVDYFEPWIIDNSTPSGQILIQKYTRQFLDLIKPLPKIELV